MAGDKGQWLGERDSSRGQGTVSVARPPGSAADGGWGMPHGAGHPHISVAGKEGVGLRGHVSQW